MSIRTALMGGLSVLLLVGISIVAAIASRQIRGRVVDEALSRVDNDLTTCASLYDNALRLKAERLRFVVDVGHLACDAVDSAARLDETRRRLGFTVLNCAGPSGEPLAGAFADGTSRVPVERDPVLRRALGGELAWGTVRFDAARLKLEGGAGLVTSQRVPPPEGGDGGTDEALFQWFAEPVRDASGRAVAVIYGGAPINHDYDMVDAFVDALFGEGLYESKPVGTVTFFLGDMRVATNVRGPDGQRAVGTRVSDEVRTRVLDEGSRWRDRAWVVDSWYISGYEPLRDPDGSTVGMLYVGLLEAPYDALQSRLLMELALPTAGLLALGLLATILVVRRITRPLEALRNVAARIEGGERDTEVRVGGSYREIVGLSEALRHMQNGIRRRDEELRGKHDELARVNANYMQTLGFVTHELKGPLANIQSLADLVAAGYMGEVPERATGTLTRIQHNCEELQDMVRNYLDLSRAERDELTASMRPIDFIADVVAPATAQVEGLFQSHRVAFETDAPPAVPLQADPALLIIALTNYLNNAAKYGKEDGRAVLTVKVAAGVLTVDVWNEGSGFTTAEREELFGKFSRLRNANTKSKKGSGLGLYLTAVVVAMHGGETFAESDPGSWARFGFVLPVPPADGGV